MVEPEDVLIGRSLDEDGPRPSSSQVDGARSTRGPVVLFGGVVVLLLFGALYLSSSDLQAWVHHPGFMYRCRFVEKLPSGMCSIGVAMKEVLSPGERVDGTRVARSKMPLSFWELRGEWFRDLGGGRELRLRGEVRNRSDFVLDRVACQATLRFRANGGDAHEVRDRDACDLYGTISPADTQRFSATFGPAIDQRWIDHGVVGVELQLEVSARSTDGKTYVAEFVRASVPLPFTRTSFDIPTRP